MTVSYALTLAQIFNSRIERYLFNLWHTSDMLMGPIRWPVFSAGIVLTVLYSAVGWSLME